MIPTGVDFPSEFPLFTEWARKKMAEDAEYVNRQAKFGSPLIRAICQMILEAAG